MSPGDAAKINVQDNDCEAVNANGIYVCRQSSATGLPEGVVSFTTCRERIRAYCANGTPPANAAATITR